MADLAVSLAKTVVQGALTKALSAIEEEATLRASTQNDLVFITGEFQMMQSFLNVADEERVSNNVVSTWVRQVRDLAYNVEDCIEYVIHLDKKSDWCCRCLILCLPVPRSLKPQLPLDKAVAEIKQLKAMVEDVSHRNMRYNLISDSGSKPATQQQLVPGASVESATFDIQFQARDTKTLQGGFGDLTKLLVTKKPGDDLGVISVWAAGGNPDTTPIIREAYADREICANFGCRGWAKLTHPFNPHEFRRSLLIQFHTNSFEQTEPSGGVSILQRFLSPQKSILQRLETAAQGELVQDFIKKLEEERYLVVLENISSMVDWDTVRAYLPEGKKGSWIIVSTQQAEVARLCIGDPWQALELKPHSAEHSAFAFVREVSQGGAGDKSKQTNEIVPNNITSPVGEVKHKGYAFYANIPTSKKNADMWMDRFPLVGVRQSQMSNLRRYLATARVDGFPVISIWGIAGVGKSALIRNLYYTIMCDTDNNIFTKFSWVDILHPFNLRNFAWSLLSEFESDSSQHNGISNPTEGCRKLLDENRCLAVVDGLQTKEEWDLIRQSLVSTTSKSIIIVITTDETVAMHCANREESMYNVKSLEGHEACDLFKTEVDKLDGVPALSNSQDPELRKLISKCGGLPKVIVAIADFLAPMTVNWMNNAINLSSTFMHDLKTKPEFDNLRGLFGWMHSYFRTCPDYLKPCILYLSIFPQGQSIRRRRLVRRWIAEGYCRDTNDKSAEENGEKFFSLLLDLSILQKTPHSITADARVVSCQVNSFFREYIICRQKDEDLVFELEGRCTLTTQRTGRHLVLKESWDRDQIVFDSIDFSGLRSLTVFGKWKPFFITESMKVLRVLDLENAKGVTYQHLEQKLRLLPRLKFLSLRGIREISRLPCSFRDLRQLETLDIWGTSIVSLPQSITKLTKLQYIRAGKAKQSSLSHLFTLPGPRRACPMGGVEVPSGIEKLTALHTLGDVNASLEGSNGILKEVKKLTQLHKVGVTGISNKNRLEFWSAISYHVHLESLSVWLSKGSEHCLDDLSLPQQKAAEDKANKKPQQKDQEKPQQEDQEEPQQMDQERHLENVRSLKLYGLSEKVPSWIKYLPKLTKLDLHMTISKKDNISEVLSEMEELHILRLHVDLLQDGVGELDFHVKYNGVERRCYEKVKMLHISCCSDLNVSFGSESLPNLELLTARCCSGSALLMFSGLNNLSKQKLKEVRYLGSLEDILKEELEKQLKKHPKEPSLKLELS